MREHTITVENRKFTYLAGNSRIAVVEKLPKNSQYAALKPLSFILERTSDDVMGLVRAEIEKRIKQEKGSNDAK